MSGLSTHVCPAGQPGRCCLRLFATWVRVFELPLDVALTTKSGHIVQRAVAIAQGPMLEIGDLSEEVLASFRETLKQGKERWLEVEASDGAVLVDFGCGAGLLAPHVTGYRHIGIDLTASALAQAAEHGHDLAAERGHGD